MPYCRAFLDLIFPSLPLYGVAVIRRKRRAIRPSISPSWNRLVFTLAHDVNGNINYFANYRNGPQVEHYIDKDGARCSTTTGFSLLAYQDAEHSIPNLP